MDGERFEQNEAGRSNPQWGPGHELDQLIWFASSALHDLGAALSGSTVKTITLAQLKDLNALVLQAQRARTIGHRIDLPSHEFNGEN